jgi:methylthioribose-1-phosphate isomerase
VTRTLWIDAAGLPRTIDQTVLPFELREISLDSQEACAEAIRTMRVRGAPLIGAVGAYGLALALRADPGDDALEAACAGLLATRPTAVNLRWALERVRGRVAGLPPARRAAVAWAECAAICDEDVACNRAIGVHAARLLVAAREADGERVLNVLTHCNAGRIATIDEGTALAAIYRLQRDGVPVHVWVDETRPRNQGASLTAWELAQRGISHTVIADNAGGLLMQRGQVDAVIVGCDRVAANGDVANKIGTYLKALAARDADVPFFVACPVASIDPGAPHGDAIEIEYRDPREITHVQGFDDEAGAMRALRIVPEGAVALNPGFDITPARLVTALVTERGVVSASREGIAALLAGTGPDR